MYLGICMCMYIYVCMCVCMYVKIINEKPGIWKTAKSLKGGKGKEKCCGYNVNRKEKRLKFTKERRRGNLVPECLGTRSCKRQSC